MDLNARKLTLPPPELKAVFDVLPKTDNYEDLPSSLT